uniref:Uncharacterized protein n=1 Tax=Schizophyllum commune (strain H4-8 / FGSC 9210) TaxID=578458 RepID=D8QGT8_SCHCM
MLTDSPSASTSTGTDSSGDAARRLVRFANRCNVIPNLPSPPGRQRSRSRTRMVVRRDTTLWSVRVPTIGFVSAPTTPHPDSPELPSALKHHSPHIHCHCESTPIAELLPAVDPPSPQPMHRTPATIPEEVAASPELSSSPRTTFLQRIGLQQHPTPPRQLSATPSRQSSTPPTPTHTMGPDEWDESGDLLMPLRPCCMECFSATEHPARAIRWTARAFRAWKEYSGPQDVKKREAEEEQRKAKLREGARDLSPSPRPLSLQLNVDEIDVLKKRRLHSLDEQPATLLDETDPHSTFSAMGTSDSPVSPSTDSGIDPSPATDSSASDLPLKPLTGAKSFDGDFPLPRSASASRVSLSKDGAPSRMEVKDTLVVPLSLPLVGKSSRTSLLRNTSHASLRKSTSRPGSSASLARQMQPSALRSGSPGSRNSISGSRGSVFGPQGVITDSPASVAEGVAAALQKGDTTCRWSLAPDDEESQSGSCSSDSEDDVFHEASEEALGVYDDEDAAAAGVNDSGLGDGTVAKCEDGMLCASISRRTAQQPAKRPSPPPVVDERPSRPASITGQSRPASAVGLASAMRPSSRASSMMLSVEPSGKVSVDTSGADTPPRVSTSSQLRPYSVTASRPLSSSSRPSSSHGGSTRPGSSHEGSRPTSNKSRPVSTMSRPGSSRRERGRPASRAGDMHAESRKSDDRGRRSASGASTERALSRAPPSALSEGMQGDERSPTTQAITTATAPPAVNVTTTAPATPLAGATPPLDTSTSPYESPLIVPETPKITPQTPHITHKVSKGTFDDGWVPLSMDDAASIGEGSDPWLGSPNSRPGSPIMRMMRSLSRGPKKRRPVPGSKVQSPMDSEVVSPAGSKDSISASGSSSSSKEELGPHPLNQATTGHNLLRMIRSRSRSRGPAARQQRAEGTASDTDFQSNMGTSFFGLVRTKSRGAAPRSQGGTPTKSSGRTPKRANTLGTPEPTSSSTSSTSSSPTIFPARPQESPLEDATVRATGRPGPASVVPTTLARASTERRASLQASPSSTTPRRSRAASTGSILHAQNASAASSADSHRVLDAPSERFKDAQPVHSDDALAAHVQRPEPHPAQTKHVQTSRRTTSFSASTARSFFSNVNFAGVLRGVSAGLGGGGGASLALIQFYYASK